MKAHFFCHYTTKIFPEMALRLKPDVEQFYQEGLALCLEMLHCFYLFIAPCRHSYNYARRSYS